MKNKKILISTFILFALTLGLHFISQRSPAEHEEVYDLFLRTSITDNREFPNFCLKAAARQEAFEKFRREGLCLLFIDNVSQAQGKEYFETIHKEHPDLISHFEDFRQNDQFGSPITFTYDHAPPISPKTLQYIKIAGDIQSHFGDLNGKRILEIGGGYGGQCAILSRLFNLKEYIIVDLPEALQLAKRYLKSLNIPNVIFKTPEELDANQVYDLVLSNFALSQCTKKAQKEYIDKILTHAKAAFLLCDEISPLYGIDSYSTKELITLLKSHVVEVLEDQPSGSSILFWH